MPTMNTGLGGPAGYGENVFSTNPSVVGGSDDGFVSVDITSVFGAGGVDFFGASYTNIFINSNGFISFGSGASGFNNGSGLDGVNLPAIVPFWSDIDITKGGEIYWDLDPVGGTVTITWDGVAPFSGAGVNSFQVVLTDTGGGSFDVEVIYEDIQWSVSGGGPQAVAGITDGGAYNEAFDGSGNAAELLAYETNDFGGGDPAGTNVVAFDGGFPEGFGVDGTAGNDTMGLGYTDADGDTITTGDDLIYGGTGNDTIDGDTGNDTVFGGAGDDTILSGSNGGGGGGGPTWTEFGAGQSVTGGSGQDFFRFTGGGGTSGTVNFNTGAGIRNGDGEADYVHVTSSADGINLTVNDFDMFTDKIVLSQNFSVTSQSLGSGTATITVTLNNGNQQTFTVNYPGGSFSSSAIFTTTLPGGPVVTDDDILSGGDGSDTFIVVDDFGNDTIVGGEGGTDDDTIDLSALTTAVTVTYTGDEAGTVVDGPDLITFSEVENFTLTGSSDLLDGDRDTTGLNVDAGAGDDYVRGGSSDDTITGGDGIDTLSGAGGVDTILGGAGDDLVAGGSGNDSLDGGIGNDSIRGDNYWLDPTEYAAVSNGPATNLTVTNSADGPIELWFIDGSGSLVFYQSIDPGDTFVQPTFEDHNWLLRDEGGFYLQLIEGAPNQTVNYGAEGLNDSISGGDGNDVLIGEYGDDSIDAGDDDDTVYGGYGDDTLAGNAGNDTLQGGTGNDRLSGGTGDDDLQGDDGSDTFVLANDHGNDTIDGGNGSDILDASAVNISIALDLSAGNPSNGENGTLTSGFSPPPAGMHYVRVFAPDDPGSINSSGIYPDGPIDFSAGTWHYVLVADDDSVLNDSQNNDPTQTFAEDLDGLPTTGNGIGAPGRSTYTDVNGDDFFVGWLTAATNAGPTGVPPFSYLFVTDANGAQPVQSGTFTGATSANAGLSYSSFTAPELGTVIFSEIEEVRLGSGDDTVTGSSGQDNVQSGAGDDTISGGDGNDTIDGGAGNDDVFGDFGDDDISGGTGNDTLRGNAGDDTIYGGDGDDVIATGSFLGGSSDGTSSTNWAFGGAGNDTIYASIGNDTLDGGAGDDLIRAQDGDDSISGGDGLDTIEGQGGNDSIDGGSGADTLIGGFGNDTIATGAGDDTVVQTRGGGADIVTDFDINDTDLDGFFNDQIDVSALQNPDGSPVTAGDVTVEDDGFGNARLIFPEGETLVLQGVSPAQMSTNGDLYSAGIPCFTQGTLIETPTGHRPIEHLDVGDIVLTREYGPQPIRWADCSTLGDGMRALPQNAVPVRFKPGVLGNTRALVVSPQHCILMRHRATGAAVYVRAKHLAEETNLASYARGRKRVVYYHIMLAAHATLISNGVLSESFYPGPCALQMLGLPARFKLMRQFPKLQRGVAEHAYGQRAAPVLNRKSLQLAARSGWLEPYQDTPTAGYPHPADVHIAHVGQPALSR